MVVPSKTIPVATGVKVTLNVKEKKVVECPPSKAASVNDIRVHIALKEKRYAPEIHLQSGTIGGGGSGKELIDDREIPPKNIYAKFLKLEKDLTFYSQALAAHAQALDKTSVDAIMKEVKADAGRVATTALRHYLALMAGESDQDKQYSLNKEIITLLIQAGASFTQYPSTKDLDGTEENLVLHHALTTATGPDGVVIIQQLLKIGADPWALSDLGETPLHSIALSDHQELSIDAVKGVILAARAQNPQGDYLHVPMKNTADTALHFAAENGDVAFVQLLLQEGADVMKINSSGNTALHLACKIEDSAPEDTKALVAKAILGANKNLVNVQNKRKQSPVHIATEAGLYDAEDLLNIMLTATPNLLLQDHEGSTALHIAAGGGLLEETTAILQVASKHPEFSSVALIRNNDGDTPLNYAVGSDHAKIVDVLLNDTAYPNLQLKQALQLSDNDGTLPLHVISSMEGQNQAHFKRIEAIAKKLLESGADVNAIDEQTGETPFLMVCYLGNLPMVRLLLAAGADVNKSNPKLGDGNGALHRAAQLCHTNIVEEIIKIGADLNALNTKGLSPLHYAAYNGDRTTAQLLIEKGANVNIHPATPNGQEHTCLTYALSSGNIMIADMLRAAGAAAS